jgi:hypothetical protein
MFFTPFYIISSCGTFEKNIASKNPNELDKSILSASETIVSRLPVNAVVALFNVSEDETELTNYVIEELSSMLINKGGLKIVERKKIENIEQEHNWQMGTGYVSDDKIISIVDKLGAEYVVSCYVTGNSFLQRLRIKTWNIQTGEVAASNVYPVDSLGAELVKSSNSDVQTIRNNGITVDYLVDFALGTKKHIEFNIYIDGTMYNFAFIVKSDEDTDDSVSFSVEYLDVKSAADVYYDSYMMSIYGSYKNHISGLVSGFSGFLGERGLDRRNTDLIANIITMIFNENVK